jgi:hypothetical protein
MWALLSRRLRTWLVLAFVLPLGRMMVHRLAVSAAQHRPGGTVSTLLGRADAVLARTSKRTRRRRFAR